MCGSSINTFASLRSSAPDFVENIPFQDDSPGLLMHSPSPGNERRDERNLPATTTRTTGCGPRPTSTWRTRPDGRRPSRIIEALYKACPRLDGIFIPGGDPGIHTVARAAVHERPVRRARQVSPEGEDWLSLQGFRGDRAEYVYRFLDEEKPDWFGGIVWRPSSPSIPSTRKRLDPRYPIRSYPDLTHNVRCQYPIPWWDTALAVTLGREAINRTRCSTRRFTTPSPATPRASFRIPTACMTT